MELEINFDDLPHLKGSKNQIKRAEEIRTKRIREIKFLIKDQNMTQKDYKAVERFINETSAKNWIANQNERTVNLLIDALKNNI